MPSEAATAFAGALEECARVKGAGESGDQLLAASGLQYMIANSNSVLVRVEYFTGGTAGPSTLTAVLFPLAE